MSVFSQKFGVPVTNISTEDGAQNGFQMFAQNMSLPPVHYSDPESDAELELADLDKRQHVYRPLRHDEIRLLILNPGKADDPIECYLEHYPVSSEKPYLALSYVWGSTANPLLIRLDGCNFPVTANLGAFLKSHRREFECHVFWIDALSINQQDIAERSSQVRLMKKVYEGADQVLIWLGYEVENTKSAFDHLKQNHNQKKSTKSDSGSSEDDDRSSDIERLHIEPPPTVENIPINALDGIMDLLARPWWTRIWVYQEATAPARYGSIVLCGSHQVDFEALRECIRHLSQVDAAQYSTRSALIMDEYSQIRRAYHRSGTSDYLLLADLLSTLRGFEATNPRDKLYALIPTSINGNDLLDVDYSLSVEDVYYNSACNILRSDRKLDFLGHCSPRDENSNLELPSWVPDWSQRKCAIHLFKRGASGTLYNACDTLVANFQIDEQRRSLKSIGMIYETVEHVAPSSGDTYDGSLLIIQWTEWLAKVGFSLSSSDSPYVAGTTVEELLLSTMVADCDRIGIDIGKRLPRTEAGKMAQDTKQLITQAISSTSRNGLRGPHPAFLYRKLIITDGGYLGLAAKHVQQGDLVTILGGAQVPVMLRCVGDHHITVGEAYIHGIMDGEAVNDARSKAWQFFHIS